MDNLFSFLIPKCTTGYNNENPNNQRFASGIWDD